MNCFVSFYKIRYSHKFSPVFFASQSFAFHVVGPLLGRSSLFLCTCLSYWRLQGDKEATTASLLTFAARRKRPLTCRPRVVTWTWPNINDTSQPIEHAHDTSAPTVGQWAAVSFLFQCLVFIPGIRLPDAFCGSDIGIGLLRRHRRRNDTCGRY